MPRQYAHIRDSYEAKGVPAKKAKRLAAMTYNAHRKPGTPPVTGKPKSEKLGDQLSE